METFDLLPSLAQGELGETSAPELVSAVFRSRASGTLWMETGESEIRCFFRAGDMCGSGSFEGFKTLAHVLLTNDWVAALDIDSSREEAASKGKRHGEVLVARRLLTPDQLRTALGAQHMANLATLLSLTRGKYDWRGWEPPPAWAREVMVDPIAVVVDALEMEQHASRRRRVLDWLGNNAARLSLDWPELQGRLNLTPPDRRAAALLALPRRLDEFVRTSRLPQTRAEALLVGLLLAGGAEPQPVSAAPPQPAIAGPQRVQTEPTPPPAQIEPETELEPLTVEPDQPHPAAMLELEQQQALGESFGEPLLDSSRAQEDPFAEPSLPAQDDPFDETQLHPPRRPPAASADPFAEPELQTARKRDDLLPEPEPTLQRPATGKRRNAPVNEAEAFARLDSLSIDETTPRPAVAPSPADEEPLEIDTRPRYDPRAAAHGREEPLELDHGHHGGSDDRAQELRKKMVARGMRNMGARAPPPREEQEGLAVEEAPVADLALDESQLSAEDQRFVDDVRSRARMAPKQNAYERLGVQPNVSNEQIKAAYLGLAKRFHPDRSSTPGLAALQPELQSLFASVQDAYDHVSTAELRTRYDALLKAGGPKGTSKKEEAGMALKMGDALVKKRDFEAAIQKLRRAVDLEPTGDALAALAWALVADPKVSHQTKEEAASLINRALRAPGATARTYYVAGVLWRTKDPDSAVDAFKKALEVDPHHPDAALELRLIEQRRGKEKKAGSGVLSGLLFGKRKS